MNKEIKEILTIEGKKIVRITCPDERFYGREENNPITGLPEYVWYPSSTWVKSYYYKSPYLINWIAEKGLTEAEAIKVEAGIKGDKIHQATEDIDAGKEIPIDAKYLNKTTGEMEELNIDEIDAIMSYRDWLEATKPTLLANEMTVFADYEGKKWAGTLDRIFKISEQVYIVDIKSSQSIWKDMLLQVASYSHADIDYQALGITEKEWKERKLAILQVGYKKNKNGYKFTEIEDKFQLFLNTYETWKEENPNSKPSQKDYPLIIKSDWAIKQLKAKTPKLTGKVAQLNQIKKTLATKKSMK